MRRATNGKYPRYIVWENVPGALSSNGGQDFKAVLENIIGIAEENVSVPDTEKGGWNYADLYLGDGWSVAYRVLDAQYWGVPQRRRRIYLVADFGGRSAGDILFKSEGLSRYSAEGFRAWQRTTNGSASGTGKTGVGFGGYNGSVDEKAATLGVNCGMSSGRNGVVLNDQGTLRAEVHHPPCGLDVYAMSTGYYQQIDKGKSPTLETRDYKNPNIVCVPTYRIGRDAFNQGKNAMFNPSIAKELQPTLVAKDPGAVCFGFYPACDRDVGRYANGEKGNPVVNGNCPGQHNGVIDECYTVRRLTPTEYARLQGFPDWWCKGLETENPTDEEVYFWHKVFEKHRKIAGTRNPKTDKQIRSWLKNPYSDSAEYKLWGNGVALPCVFFVMAGIDWVYRNGDEAND